MGREEIRQAAVFQRVGEGRTFRRFRAARSICARSPQLLQADAMTASHRRNPARLLAKASARCAIALALIVVLAGFGSGSEDEGELSAVRVNKAVELGRKLAYQPPAKGFGYPQSEETLAGYLAALDVPAMRAHAWDIWAALTATSNSRVPIMLTWYQNGETFGAGTIDKPRKFLPQFLTGPRDSLG